MPAERLPMPETERGLLILARPHASLWDGPRVAWWLSKVYGVRNAVFPVDPDYASHPLWARLLRRYGDWVGGHWMVPMDTHSPFGLRHLANALHRGQTVVLFPQGTGIKNPGRPDLPGHSWLIEREHPRVVPITISGSISIDRHAEDFFHAR